MAVGIQTRRLSWRAIKRWHPRSIAITVGILLEVIVFHLAFEGIIITKGHIISFEAAMMITSFACVLPLILLLHVLGVQGLTGVCNQNQLPSGSPFFSTIGQLLVQIEQNAPLYSFNYITIVEDPTTGTAAYGQGICSASGSREDCASCLKTVGDSIWKFCNNALAALVEDGDVCSILYDIIPSSSP